MVAAWEVDVVDGGCSKWLGGTAMVGFGKG